MNSDTSPNFEEFSKLTDDEIEVLNRELGRKVAKRMLLQLGTAIAFRIITQILIKKLTKPKEEDDTDED